MVRFSKGSVGNEYAATRRTDDGVEVLREASKVRGGFQVSERLRDCAAKLRDHLRGPAVSHWLKENHSLIQSHISDLRHTLRPAFLRRLHQNEEGEPRIHRIVILGRAAEIALHPRVEEMDIVLRPAARDLPAERQPARARRHADRRVDDLVGGREIILQHRLAGAEIIIARSPRRPGVAEAIVAVDREVAEVPRIAGPGLDRIDLLGIAGVAIGEARRLRAEIAARPRRDAGRVERYSGVA